MISEQPSNASHQTISQQIVSEDLIVAVQMARRIERLPLSRIGVYAILTAAFCFFVEAMDATVIADILGPIQRQLHLSVSQVGLLSVSVNITTVIGLLIAGRLADQFGRKRLLVVGLTGCGFFGLATYFAEGYASLVVLRLLTGFWVGTVLVVPMTYMTEFVPSRWRAYAAGFCNAAFGVAYVVTLLLAHTLVPAFGYHVMFAVTGLFLLAVPLVVRFAPESPRWLLLHGNKDKAELMVRTAEDNARARGYTLVPLDAIPVFQQPTSKSGIMRSLARLSPALISILTLSLIVNQTRLLYMPYILQMHGISYKGATLQSAFMNVMAIPGNLLAGVLAAVIGRRLTIALFGVGTALAVFAFGMSASTAALLLSGTAIFFFDVIAVPKAFVNELMLTSVRASGAASVEFVARIISQVMWVPFVPFLLNGLGLSTLFTVIAVASFAGITLAVTLLPETKDRAIV